MSQRNTQSENRTPESADKAPESAKTPETPKQPEVVEEATVKVGEVYRLSAVYGDLINPNTLHTFKTDREDKVVVDAWVKVQFDAGKLKLAD